MKNFRKMAFLVSTGFLIFCSALSSAFALSPERALQAEAMLSPSYWAQAVMIENTNPRSRYPAIVYGTIFDFQNLLWFYTKTGTQPLQVSANRVDEFKENLLPLLQTIEPGFAAFTELVDEEPSLAELATLKNGCVVESIFSFNRRKQEGEPILEAKLLLYSSKNAKRSPGASYPTGHAVLVYKTPSGIYFVDPPKIDATGEFVKITDWDPMKMAGEIESHYGVTEIETAFFEPFEIDVPTLASSD